MTKKEKNWTNEEKRKTFESFFEEFRSMNPKNQDLQNSKKFDILVSKCDSGDKLFKIFDYMVKNVLDIRLLFNSVSISVFSHFLRYLTPYIAKNSDLYDIILERIPNDCSQIGYDNILGRIPDNCSKIEYDIRSFRMTMFRMAIKRCEYDICLNIIRQLKPISDNRNFTEFNQYLMLMVPVLDQHKLLSRSIFEMVVILAASSKGYMRDWLIMYLINIATYQTPHTFHESLNSFIHAQGVLQQTKSKFERRMNNLFGDDCSLWYSPPLTRMYYLSEKWNSSLEKIDSISSKELLYNLMILESRKQTVSKQLLLKIDKLKNEDKAKAYFILSEHCFEQIIDILPSLSKEYAAEYINQLAIHKPHLVIDPRLIEIVSNMKPEMVTDYLTNLVKVGKIDFSKLFPHIKHLPLEKVKSIIYEGLIQLIERKYMSRDNAENIKTILSTYFGSDNRLNKIFSTYPNGSSLSKLVILEVDKSKSSNSAYKFMDNITGIFYSLPRYSQVYLVIPLLLSMANTNINIKLFKTVTSLLPGTMCKSEIILIFYASLSALHRLYSNILDLNFFRMYIVENFGYGTSSCNTFFSLILDTFLYIHSRSDSYIQRISSHLYSNIAFNIIKLRVPEFDKHVKEIPLLKHIHYLYEDSSYNVTDNIENQFDADILKKMKESWTVSKNDYDKTRTDFSSLREMKLYFIYLSLGCRESFRNDQSLKTYQNIISNECNTIRAFMLDALANLGYSGIDTKKLIKEKQLSDSLTKYYCSINDNKKLEELLSFKHSYSNILNVKAGILHKIDQNILINFIEATIDNASTNDIILSLNNIRIPSIILIILEKLTQRNIIDYVVNNKIDNITNILNILDKDSFNKFTSNFSISKYVLLLNDTRGRKVAMKYLFKININSRDLFIIFYNISNTKYLIDMLDSILLMIKENSHIIHKLILVTSILLLLTKNGNEANSIKEALHTNPDQIYDSLFYSIFCDLLFYNYVSSEFINEFCKIEVDFLPLNELKTIVNYTKQTI